MNSKKWSKSDRNNVRFLPVTATHVCSSLIIFTHVHCTLHMFHLQLLQSLNLMDYSLLVGIHDCTIPPDVVDEFEDDGDDYDSSEGYTDQPLSPCNAGKFVHVVC